MKTEPPQESANARLRLWDHMVDTHDLYLTVSEIDDIYAATKNMKTEHDTTEPCYAPETAFRREGNLVYNLKHYRWQKGVEEFENDVAIRIEARDLPQSIQDEIGGVITTALNRSFAQDATAQTSPTENDL